MFLFSTGEIIPLVTTPTVALPTCAPSPLVACSLPISSKPTSFFCGEAFLFIKASFPTKLSSLVFRATEKPIPASNGSVWSLNSKPPKINHASILTISKPSSPIGVIPRSFPHSQTLSQTSGASFG